MLFKFRGYSYHCAISAFRSAVYYNLRFHVSYILHFYETQNISITPIFQVPHPLPHVSFRLYRRYKISTHHTCSYHRTIHTTICLYHRIIYATMPPADFLTLPVEVHNQILSYVSPCHISANLHRMKTFNVVVR